MWPSSPLFFLCSLHSCGDCKRQNLGVKELLKVYWVCFHAYCHSSVTEWEATRLRWQYAPWPLTCTSSHCMWVCAACVGGAATAVRPPSAYSPFKYLQTKHTHQMLAYQYKDMHRSFAFQYMHLNRNITFQRKDSVTFFFFTLALWLSTLNSMLWPCCCFVIIHTCQLGYIRLISVCTCLKQLEEIHM